jgi:hypothetical protein
MKAPMAFLVMSLVVPASGQMTRQQKLAQIDREIAWYESQERKGTLLMAGGVVSSLVAIPFWIPNDEGEIHLAPAASLQSVGLVLAWWGMTTRWNAQEYLRLLRVKRYDFTLGPMFLPERGQALGASLTVGI